MRKIIILFLMLFLPLSSWAALRFDGTNDYVTVPTSAAILGAVPHTISAWVYYDAISGATSEDPIISWGWSNNGLRLIQLRSSKFFLSFYANDFDTGIYPQAGIWQHVAWVFQGNGVPQFLYINGILRYTSPNVNNVNTLVTAVDIGRWSAASAYLGGRMDEVRVYNRALSRSEITALYNKSPGTAPAQGLVGYWPLHGNSLNFEPDFSEKQNSGTAVNGPVKWNKSPQARYRR